MEMKGGPASENEKIWANIFKQKVLNLTEPSIFITDPQFSDFIPRFKDITNNQK